MVNPVVLAWKEAVRMAFETWLKGLDLSPAQIAFAAAPERAIAELFAALKEPGKSVLFRRFVTPAFPSCFSSVHEPCGCYY